MKTINTLLASLTLKEKLSIHIQKRVYGGVHIDTENSIFQSSSPGAGSEERGGIPNTSSYG